MKILFLQLPVPTLVSQKSIGNHLLASSSLFLHAMRMNSLSAHQLSALPQEVCSRGGDLSIINAICEEKPDVLACTCTVWNIERTLYIAKKLKSKFPDIKIWFGGPEIASDAFFMNDSQEQPFDLAVEGEGEEVFRSLLQGVDPAKINRVYVPNNKKEISVFPQALKDLHTIHEPFIHGFAQMEQDGVVLSELFRGCKYGCLFCRYHTGDMKKTFAFRPYDQVKELIDWARSNGTKEIFLLDPSFEQRPDLDEFLDFLSGINRDPQISIFAELRAEAVDKKLAEKLKSSGIHHVETGLQTVNKIALKNVGRSFDKVKFVDGINNLQSVGIKIRPDIMIGLPGDTPEGFYETAEFVKELGLASYTQVFKTQILPGTILRKQAERYKITYEKLPPYQVLSTPQWSKELLDESLYTAEELLGTRCAPEDSPVLVFSNQTQQVRKFNNTEIIYAYYFDCSSDKGREFIVNEEFKHASCTLSLTCKVDRYDQIDVVRKCLTRFYEANPFSSSIVAFQIQPLFPLDIFDIVNEIKQQNCHSTYLQSLFPTTYSRTPHRRMLAALNINDCQSCTKSWLSDLRDIAEVVWIMPFSLLRNGTFETFGRIEEVDYLYLDSANVSIQEKTLQSLSRSPFGHQLIFSDMYTQWRYIELRAGE
jgi:radical SAM superfamily enzyme YgiQ (UPF0313 family)